MLFRKQPVQSRQLSIAPVYERSRPQRELSPNPLQYQKLDKSGQKIELYGNKVPNASPLVIRVTLHVFNMLSGFVMLCAYGIGRCRRTPEGLEGRRVRHIGSSRGNRLKQQGYAYSKAIVERKRIGGL
jgi:hypothetical protein